ncbi:MAG: Flp pilus assembly complex ATPase component TadA [Sporichthyaceae bacterium]|nr:Flp pilus assembly complex ATPase component TadA [Sporichthyaceae bacterium]
MSLDHAVVKRLGQQVGEQLAATRRGWAADGRASSRVDEQAHALAVIRTAVDAHIRDGIRAGHTPPSRQEEEQLASAVFAALYGLGRLEPLLADPRVSDVEADGHDSVFVSYRDGAVRRAEPIADSNEEMIALIQSLAAYSGLTARRFDRANPRLELRLPDGSRLSALMEVTPVPVLCIRRAPVERVMLADLLDDRYQMLTPELASLLSAAVRARANIMVSGAIGAGKTTLVRALANEIDPDERIITVESVLELGLHTWRDLHPRGFACETREPNAEGFGEITLADLLRSTLRMNPDRVIVGEVVGAEVLVMLTAMRQGNNGSLSTIHARSSAATIDQIVAYAMKSENMTAATANAQINGALDFIVYIERRRTPTGLRRRIASVREINGFDGEQVLTSEVFTAGPDGYAVPAARISRLELLIEHGYQPQLTGDPWERRW